MESEPGTSTSGNPVDHKALVELCPEVSSFSDSSGNAKAANTCVDEQDVDMDSAEIVETVPEYATINGVSNSVMGAEKPIVVVPSPLTECRSVSLLETIKEDASQDEGNATTSNVALLAEDIGSATRELPVIVVNPVGAEDHRIEGEDEMEPLLAVDDTESFSSDMISLDTVSYDIINLDIGEEDDHSIDTMSTASYDIKLDSPLKRPGSRASESSMTTRLLDNSKKDSSVSETPSPTHHTMLSGPESLANLNELEMCIPSSTKQLISCENSQASHESETLVPAASTLTSYTDNPNDEITIESEVATQSQVVCSGMEGEHMDDGISSAFTNLAEVFPSIPDINPEATDQIEKDMLGESPLDSSSCPVRDEEVLSVESDKTNVPEPETEIVNITEAEQSQPELGEICFECVESNTHPEQESATSIQGTGILVEQEHRETKMEFCSDLTSIIEKKNNSEDHVVEGKDPLVEQTTDPEDNIVEGKDPLVEQITDPEDHIVEGKDPLVEQITDPEDNIVEGKGLLVEQTTEEAVNISMKDHSPVDEVADNHPCAVPIIKAENTIKIEKLDVITTMDSDGEQPHCVEINEVAISMGAGDSAQITETSGSSCVEMPECEIKSELICKPELSQQMPIPDANNGAEILSPSLTGEENVPKCDDETNHVEEIAEQDLKRDLEPLLISLETEVKVGTCEVIERQPCTVQGTSTLSEEFVRNEGNTALEMPVDMVSQPQAQYSSEVKANVSPLNFKSSRIEESTAHELASNLVSEILDVATKEIQSLAVKSVSMPVNEEATLIAANAVVEEVLDLAAQKVSDVRWSTQDSSISTDVIGVSTCENLVRDMDQDSEHGDLSELCDKSEASDSTLAECVLGDCSLRRESNEDDSISGSSGIESITRKVNEHENSEEDLGKALSSGASSGSDSARGSSLLTANVITLQQEANIFVDGVIKQAVHHIEDKNKSPETVRPKALNSDFSEPIEEELATPCGELLTEHFMDFESGRNVSVFRSMPDENELFMSSEHLFAYDRVVSTIGTCEVDSGTGKSVSVFRSDDEIFYEIQRASTCTSVFESVEEEDEDMIDTTVPVEDRPEEEAFNISSGTNSNICNDDMLYNPKDKDCDAFEDAVDAFLEKERSALNEQKSSNPDTEEISESLDELGTGLRKRKAPVDNEREKETSLDEDEQPICEVICISSGKHSDSELSDSEEKKRMAARWANGGESEVPNTPDMWEKQRAIQEALKSGTDVTFKLCKLALTEGGLISDALRREAWPRMLGLDPMLEIPAPPLEELKSHPEYGQVVLDVNRSLKRFPPDIPHDQRETLQDKLTRLIMYVITKYPHLRYYQGYHDVAVTFLLVVGEAAAFQIMERLSTEHLSDCMQPTMERTSYLLHYIYPLLHRLNPTLADYLERSEVGTMFCLPWFLTWFGHSLNRYQDVVRLYDHFLASPPLAPLYLAAVLVAHRADEVLAVDCDMAAIHALLSHIPDTLPLEILLRDATDLYERYPPESIEPEVEERFKNEQEMRIHEMEARDRIRHQRALQRRHGSSRDSGSWQVMEFHNRIAPAMMAFNHWMPPWAVQQQRLSMRLLFASATFFAGFYFMYARGGESFPYP